MTKHCCACERVCHHTGACWTPTEVGGHPAVFCERHDTRINAADVPTPETTDLYLIGSRAAQITWGYAETLDPRDFDRVTTEYAENPGFQAAVDAVAAHAERQAVLRAAQAIIDAGNDLDRKLAWMYPEQAAAIVRDLAEAPGRASSTGV
jgi:hypothetical protein